MDCKRHDTQPARGAAPANVVFENLHPAQTESRAELLAGLQLPQKRVDPKYFYDVRGSELFEQITQQPEYYPTRTEKGILDRYATEIAACCGAGCVLIEPGSGNSEKVRLLLKALRPAAYVPVDISSEFLYATAVKLGGEYPWLKVHAVCADFGSPWQEQVQLPVGRRVVFYPGSTIGNMEPSQAQAFLSGLRRWLGRDGGILIGVDLHKSAALLNAAYNDSRGVTAQFNLNILNALNRQADGNFRQDAFSHRAFYNSELKRIEMHLVSNEAQTVAVNGRSIHFRQGETLHTENSYKYSLQHFSALSESAGFALEKSWLDADELFSVHYLTVV
ncbi:L-histidine N(alpha)-methyltransferase [Haliea sp.]|jgi:dimethylhistidine N-methyltransferase|uniref:L-histidine N(alpha)-methyltransferase n=1 Tax=Haliea TaxID=475794 RepID=UPI000C450215|nr:L-histidine N(alpha)-methyltransferase [Haliea sp.]HCD56629.1 L-histidine N(alpha)-methyltransferase [Halieaceae bacterium]MAD62101.1 L-histidine N(alpha)-methyltransferase [Haliea sp.]MAY93896.1 L-histidine N(alpha)-methyltransferase [Haliea sp.]MBK41655.1 L-histidine N(alpha)-methyltransferase [Haliea sp.]MBP70917.1 L-histidine N(alpha)-methyltransferase [Haliea sp.]|tara:strand:- start:3636 stop:4634 length:999 start_codon:yes stop_codon:yes gene_type:complete